MVASQPLGSAQDTLNVTVTEFNGRYDGKVIVSGEWLLNHQLQLIKRPFLEGVQTQDGYDEMVKVLAGVWSQASRIADKASTVIIKICERYPSPVCCLRRFVVTCGKICSSSHFLYNRHARVAHKYESGVNFAH